MALVLRQDRFCERGHPSTALENSTAHQSRPVSGRARRARCSMRTGLVKSLNLCSFGPGQHALALRHIVVTLAWLFCVPAVLAQQAQVVHEGPHYVGEPFLIRVAAEGFEEDPTPGIP